MGINPSAGPILGLATSLISLVGVGVTSAALGQTVTEFALPASVKASDITAGPDGALWFSGGLQGTGGVTGLVGRISTSGQITTYSDSVALSSVGASASRITGTANTRSACLPVTIAICQTNPTTRACLQSPSPSVTATVNANATSTFGIFAISNGAVPFSLGTSRVFVQFSDAGGVVRGATSVAVTTT